MRNFRIIIFIIIVVILSSLNIFQFFLNNKLKNEVDEASSSAGVFMQSACLYIARCELNEYTSSDLKAFKLRAKKDIIDYSKVVNNIDYHVLLNSPDWNTLEMLNFNDEERKKLYSSVKHLYEDLLPRSYLETYQSNRMEKNKIDAMRDKRQEAEKKENVLKQKWEASQKE